MKSSIYSEEMNKLKKNIAIAIASLQNRRDFLRISGEQGRRRGKRELRAWGGSLKNPACRHTIVQAVPGSFFKSVIRCHGGTQIVMFFEAVEEKKNVEEKLLYQKGLRGLCTA